MSNEQVTDDELEASIGAGIVPDEGGGEEPTEEEKAAKIAADAAAAAGDGDAGEKGGEGEAGEPDAFAVMAKEFSDFKSEAGRKQKATDENIAELSNNINTLVTAIKSGGMNQQQQQEEDPFDPDDPIPLTMGGLLESVKTFMGKEKSGEAKETSAYQDRYLDVIEGLGKEYPDNIHKHIVDRMFKQFNIKHSDNPGLDAQLNFRNAEAAILREVRTRKANPLEKNKGAENKNLGGSNNTNQDINTEQPVKLDNYASEFIKATGMKEEDAQKALTGDMPMYLRGKVRV